MAEEKKRISPAIGLGIAAGLVAVMYFVTRAKAAPGEIALSSGWNEVIYTGPTQTAGEAFASIEDYLVIAYIFHEDNNQWYQLLSADTIWRGRLLSINVSQDCVWTF